jgi:cytochrome c oxidase assembly protein subunit 15
MRRPVAAWLLMCCALVFAMVVVGGVTRLTHSGLSITSGSRSSVCCRLFRRRLGRAFAKYRETPEFRQSTAQWPRPNSRILGRNISTSAGRSSVSRSVAVSGFDPPAHSAGYAAKLLGIFVWARRAPSAVRGASGLVDDRAFRHSGPLRIRLAVATGAMLWVALSILFPAACRLQRRASRHCMRRSR